jgi:hypothetical protein
MAKAQASGLEAKHVFQDKPQALNSANLTNLTSLDNLANRLICLTWLESLRGKV